ncbi:MAG: hypothetical protein ORN49_09620 [Rhodobacteraceae bacterium]|nr:hypothetical protein [Paracoccaceae bacterium]
MTWDQIETKWAAAARRMRADLPVKMTVGAARQVPERPSDDGTEQKDAAALEAKAG